MPERLTDARIEELLSLESKATQGEWIVSDDTCRVCREDGGEFNIDPVDGGMHGMFAGRDNPDFIAASRNSIRSLLEEVRERRAAEKSCTQPMTPNDHLDLIYETAIARADPGLYEIRRLR